MTFGLAAMVKTPGLSPVKTRLAATLGKNMAEKIYQHCLVCIEELLKGWGEQPSCVPYWALAEKDAIKKENFKFGNSLFRLLQEGEGLGARMESIANQLFRKHEYICLIGADSPQLDSSIINKAFTLLNRQPHNSAQSVGGVSTQSAADLVLGPSADGGFYLLATQIKLDSPVWRDTVYSTENTLQNFVALAQKYSPKLRIDISSLPVLSDLDTIEDVQNLLNQLQPPLTAPQLVLKESLLQILPNSTSTS